MSKANCNNNRGQSFKAIENFLRRVAHNLGNSPSQTDVKIVSCIPIDVTDLQQRIFQLQNELADIKKAKKGPPKPDGCAVCARRNESVPRQVCCNECLLTTTSVLSVYCPGRDSSDLNSESSEFSNHILARSEHEVNTEKPITPKESRSRNIFSKKKKETKNKNLKTQFVYRAHADTYTPFRNVNLAENLDTAKANVGDVLSPSYLANVLHRQYQQRSLVGKSNLSDISSPVCRDNILTTCEYSPHSESDVCSCCHGQFQNIDDYMTNRNQLNIYSTCENVRNYQKSSYYDSNFYDVVPVRDKGAKNRNNIERQKAKELKKPTIQCWPGKTRLKHRNNPTVVNYCALSPQRNEYARNHPTRSPNVNDVIRHRTIEKNIEASTPRQVNDEIVYSHVYPKPERKHAKRGNIPTKTLQNATTSSPATDNMAGRQTATTITDNTPPEDKTETTLNEIKDILQSVLTEVKTSSKMAKPPSQPKRDAVVQNGPAPTSRGYEYGASRLLQSYTYSPYNMNINPYNMNRNPYKPSCSHPISTNNYMNAHMYPEYPGVPPMPMQQYPLLIQPQKHLCNSYYGNNGKPVPRHATSAATNTEQAQERSKETERLIKEIYKSIALNMEESSKDNSVLEYMKTKSITDKYVNITKTESDIESERVAKAISEIFKNTNLQDSTATGTTGSTNNSYVDQRKSRKMTEEPNRIRGHGTEKVYTQKETSKYTDDITERKTHRHYTEESSDNTVINEDTEESSSETETDEVVEVKKEPAKSTAVEIMKIKEPLKVVEPKKEKSGLFKKMLKIFQPRPRRRRERRDSVENDSEETSESDSDDYQTVYSQKVAAPKPKKVTVVRSRPHSKVFYVKQPQHRSRTRSPEKQSRTPHADRTETENRYKRYRDVYENQRNRYPTAKRGTGDREHRHTHAYYQKYEARPVLVDQSSRVPQRIPNNASRPRYSPHRTQYPKLNEEKRYPNTISKTAAPASRVKPHFVASKNSTKRGFFSKGWMNKTKIHCGKCGQDWKDLIING